VLAVALATRWLVPGMPWPVAIALGAIVAPPDAAAATAVMRQMKLPHKLLKILAIAARFAWVMGYNALIRWRHDHVGEGVRRRPKVGSGIVVSWAGMRGIVTLAAAFAIPETLPNGSPFPYRDLILRCAFAVVLGTLVLQGLTMKPLIGRMGLTDDDPVGREIRLGRTHAYSALVDAIKDDETLSGKLLRKEYGAVVELNTSPAHDVPVDEVPGKAWRERNHR
jgi:NhaP-type Na+/H+ or K+/H+ antiporter